MYIWWSQDNNQWKWHCLLLTLLWEILPLNLMLAQHRGSLRAVLHGHECEQLQIKGITKNRFFIPTPLMKNVQRHIHYFIELTECDMWRATATEGREAAMPPAALWGRGYICCSSEAPSRCTPSGFFQMVEGAACDRVNFVQFRL